MTETRILLIRHPETFANVEGRFVGRGDSPYTVEGRRQFARIPRKIARFAPDHVWGSPLPRALRLARRVSKVCAAPLRVDERLVELDFGDAEGMTYSEIAEAGMDFNYRDSDRPVAPNGETRASISLRAGAVCADLIASGGRHVVVTHGGVFRAALVALLGLAHDDIWAFHIHNAQLATVHVIEGHGMLVEYVTG